MGEAIAITVPIFQESATEGAAIAHKLLPSKELRALPRPQSII